MAAAPSGTTAFTDDEPRSSLDRLTDDTLASGDLDEPTEGEPKAEPAPTGVKQEDFDALKKQNSDLAAQAEITNRYLQGLLADRRPAEPKPDDGPKPLELNLEEYGEKIAVGGKAGMEALLEVMQKFADHREQQLERRVDERTGQRLSARDAQDQRNSRFQSELSELQTKYSDLWDNDDFKAACDKEALDILRSRGGSKLTDFQPGDLKAAAKSVYADWKSEGKIKPKPADAAPKPAPSLRELVRRQPKSDDLGSGNKRGGSSKPRSIAELYPDDARMQDQCRVVAKKLGVDEADFVEQTLAAAKDDEDYGK